MLVYDANAGVMSEVTPAEAQAGLLRYARTLGAGSAACGEWERRCMMAIMAGLSDEARAEISAATREGHARARAAGKTWGGSRPRKLSDADVKAIRTAKDGGAKVADLAVRYGVSRQAIYKALRR